MARENKDPTENESHPLPIWLSIPIILLCLGAGGWMIHWYIINDPIDHSIKVLGDPAKLTNMQPFNRPPGNWNGGPPGRQRLNDKEIPRARFNLNSGRWEVVTELATVYAPVDAKGNVSLRLRYTRYNAILSDDIKSQLGSASLLLKNKEKLDAMSLTDLQKKKLNALAADPDLMASAADKETLKKAITELIHAPEAERPKLEPNLYKLLDEIAQRSLPATLQLAADHVKEINAILATAKSEPGIAAPAH